MASREDPALTRPLVLVGMMGAGKTAIGRRVANRLHLDFVDADVEIEAAAGCSISDIFAQHGEQAFRDGEHRVILRLLDGGPRVIATGGGAFMNPETRAAIKSRGVSVWLKADFDTLWRRVIRRDNRPMLKTADPQATLRSLMVTRYPVYAEADIVVESTDGPREATVDRVLAAVREYLEGEQRHHDRL